MASLKPAYLVHGDDHGAIAERRASLKALAEREAGAGGVETLAGGTVGVEGVAGALARMTLAPTGEDAGTVDRVIVVDGAERFKQADVTRVLSPAMELMAPRTVLALFAREDGRSKAPEALHEAVKKAGGQVIAHATVKPWELPKWVRAQAGKLGLELEMEAAKVLVAQVGERQQRLMRELEKLALQLGAAPSGGRGANRVEGRSSEAGGRRHQVAVDAEQVEALTARSSERKAFTLADALVAGEAARAVAAYTVLESQGERLGGMIYLIASRLREALAVAARLQAGEAPAAVSRSLRMPPRAAGRFVAEVAGAEEGRLERAVQVVADLELDLHGGSSLTVTPGPGAALSEQTLAIRAIESIAG